MSGGVDSSVAAALLKKQGYEVIGVFMKFWSPSYAKASEGKLENICCSLESSTAARAVANKLNIPFYVVNFAKEFKRSVVDYFIKEYEGGRTPNPCVICNRDIKGEILMKKVMELDGDYLATGHYARIESGSEISKSKFQITNKAQNPNFKLLKSKDKNKDQTYFLWTLTQEKLAKLLFPVGDLTKSQVRSIAKEMKLPTAERRESQGICFIPDGNISMFLRRYAKQLLKPGDILDTAGNRLGAHNGLIDYTIGQREHLGLGGPRAYYVIKLDCQNNILVVGEEKELYKKSLIATDLSWITSANSKRLAANGTKAKIRYGHPSESCDLEAVGRKQFKVTFTKSQRAITPGQSIVFYKRDEVLGGGIISKQIGGN